MAESKEAAAAVAQERARLSAERVVADQAEAERQAAEEHDKLAAAHVRFDRERRQFLITRGRSDSPAARSPPSNRPGTAEKSPNTAVIRSAAVSRPSDAEIVRALAVHYSTEDRTVVAWLLEFDHKGLTS